jgi:hypothetical protein
MPVTLQDLADCVRRQMAEIDRLRSVNAKQAMEIDTLVAWAANDFDALMALQAIYRNPNSPEGNRVNAAKAALGFERAKPASTVNNVVNFSLFKHLEEAKTIEHQPRLDLEPPTILGHDGGPEPAA